MPEKSDVEIAQEVLEWFRNPSHWTQGRMGVNDVIGELQSTCLLGGVHYVRTGFWRWTRTPDVSQYKTVERMLARVIQEQFPDRKFGEYGFVSHFNDDSRTRHEDVLLVCEKTLARLQETEGIADGNPEDQS